MQNLIARSLLPPGSTVPSVRVLARHLHFNPGIVAKAYQWLATIGFLIVRCGEGTFVCDLLPPSHDVDPAGHLEAAARYASGASVGATRAEAVTRLRQLWRELERAPLPPH